MNFELNSILPILSLVAGIVVLLIQISIRRSPQLSWLITEIALVLTIFAALASWHNEAVAATPLLQADRYALFFTILILLSALTASLLSRTRIGDSFSTAEFCSLLLLATLGAVALTYSNHLASFVIGLELLGVSLYALIAFSKNSQLPLEAAIKYLVLSGAASAILLFGFALLYAALGALSFSEIGIQLASAGAEEYQVLTLAAAAMILVGIGFKLSLVPFHMWTPDVYQGASAPITAFLATVSKCAVFVVMMRWYLSADMAQYASVSSGLSLLAILSMLIGNLLALKQQNIKRLLAYSSTAHFGYLLVALVVLGAQGTASATVEAVALYLAAYIVTSLAAFTCVSVLEKQSDSPIEVDVASIQGLFWRQPVLALTLMVALLSLAGIPMTLGFIGKFYLFSAAVASAQWLLLSALVVGSGIGIYYYLRLIFAMTGSTDAEDTGLSIGLRLSTLALSLSVAVLVLGLYPQPLIHYLTLW